jgi:hypothetical protein
VAILAAPWLLALGAVASASSVVACGDDPAPASVRACADVAAAKASPSCTPLYEPTYANVFDKTLKPTCAKSGVSCHASTGRQGGLAFDDADESHKLLLETTQAVRAGDPACSALVGRIVASDGKVRMPPGRSLEPSEQCSVIQWIASGAKR